MQLPKVDCKKQECTARENVCDTKLHVIISNSFKIATLL